MLQFTSYLRRVLCRTRLIFPRINGPNVKIPETSGGSRGGASPPPLICRPNWDPTDQKNFFLRLPPPLSQGLDGRLAPPPLSEGLDPPLETSFYTFFGGNVVRGLVHFFSVPLTFTLHWWPLAFLILSPPLPNFHVVLPTKKCLLFFHLSL